MKIPCTVLSVLFSISALVAQPGWQWVRNGISNYQQYIGGVTCDPAGNSVACGHYQGDSISFGADSLHNSSFMPANSPDAFVVSYNSAGTLNWVRNIGGFYAERGADIAADAQGNIYVAGHMDSPGATFDSINLPLGVGNTMFYAKYNSAGIIQWAKSVNANPQANVWARSIDCDPAGNIYITGEFNVPQISFGSVTITGGSSGGIFLAKFDTNGNCIWGISPTCDFASATDVKCDPSGDVIFTGAYLAATMTFGSTVLTNSNGTSGEIFIAKYSSAGSFLWAKTFAGTGSDETFGLTTDPSGNIYFGGLIGNNPAMTITFGSTTLTSQGTMDLFITKLNSAGSVLWAKGVINPAYHFGTAMDCDGAGYLYITGNYSDSLSFDAIQITGGGSFVAQYDQNGNAQWVKQTATAAMDVACEQSSSLFVAGFGYGAAMFDTHTFNGGVYVAKLSGLVGIEENSTMPLLSPYPNPATQTIIISDDPEFVGSALSIYDVKGEMIFTNTVTTMSDLTVDVSTFASGMYCVQLVAANGDLTSARFMVK